MFGEGSCGGWEKSPRTLSPFSRGFGFSLSFFLLFVLVEKSKMGWIPKFFLGFFVWCVLCFLLVFCFVVVSLKNKNLENLENFSLLRNTFFLRFEEQKSRDFLFVYFFKKHTQNTHTQNSHHTHTHKNTKKYQKGFGLFENFLRN